MIIIKIFLDTSYLFPFFLLETDIKGYSDDISIILEDNQNNYFYSNVSLIELKWQFIKLERENDKLKMQSNFNRFHNILIKDKRLKLIMHSKTDINLISDKIRNAGHKDYFDTIIAASSLWHCDYLITEDNTLKKRLIQVNKNKKYNDNFQVINWREFKKLLN